MIHKYWTDEDYRLLEKAKSYRDLCHVAFAVLGRAPCPAVQVCGPISTGGAGSVELNIKRLNDAIKTLIDRGLFVFDQIPFEEPMQRIKKSVEQTQDGDDYAILNGFYLPIFEHGFTSRFFFLPDWQTSIGATWEHDQAERLGIPAEYIQ